jgi:signal transduction histidine kinase/ActR/RegA family two-component response regulator
MKEQLLTAYLDAMPAEAYVKDLDGNYLYANRQFCINHGISLEEDISLTQLTDFTLFGAEMAQKHGILDQQVIETGQQVASSQKHQRVISVKFPMLNDDGNIVAIGGLVQDLDMPVATKDQLSSLSSSSSSSRFSPCPSPYAMHRRIKRPKSGMGIGGGGEEKQASFCEDDEVTLDIPDQALEHNYERLFTNMQMGACVNEVVTDEANNPIDFVFREINPAFEELTGLKESQTIGRLASEVLPGIHQDPSDWVGKIGKVALDGMTFKFDRQYFPNLKKWLGGMAYRPGGQRGIFVSLFLDVTESVQAEENLRESEERHRNLFESMMQGVVYQDHTGQIIAANPSAERILGLTIDQMMGRSSVDPRWKAIREDGSDFPGDQHPAMEVLRTGKSVTGVFMGVYHPNTELHHWIIIDAIPRFRPGETKPFQVYCTFTDMTQTKEFERRLLREKERAEMADRLKSAFLANMSHEIRTPLNGIIGHIDLALSNELSEMHRRENLDGLMVARQSGELLIAIIQDILDLSKIEAGQMAIENDGNFHLRKLVDQVSSLGDTMINQRSKAIRFESEVHHAIQDHIRGDLFRLQQVLNNLISNAVKFTDSGTVRLVITQYDEQMLKFCVCDTGKGIPKDNLESIFEPFRQVEIGDTRKHGGTGLGLTISKKLVELMGGQLSVMSSVEPPNRGSCFSFTFPYRIHAPSPGTTPMSSPPAPTGKIVSSETTIIEGKILVAEDDTVSRRLVQRMLHISGYETILAEDGEQAVRKFQENDCIALILMDVQMPNMDGLAATTLIRELESKVPDRKPIPIIALSAGAMKGDDERGLAVGMTDYLTKPVNFKLLQKTLHTHLGPRPTHSSDAT